MNIDVASFFILFYNEIDFINLFISSKPFEALKSCN